MQAKVHLILLVAVATVMAQGGPVLKHFTQIGNGFYHLRGTFRLGYAYNIGTHMALARLQDGKYCVLDAMNVSAEQKADIDAITENGNLIDSVILTHPFHTGAIAKFYDLYPQAKYYGCPRHLRMLPDIPWAGDFSNPETLQHWEERGLSLRYPDGAEFVNPKPELYNHFSNVFVYHKESKTVFNDDTITKWTGSFLYKKGLGFHPTLTTVGLYPTVDAPLQFKQWMKKMLDDWDFENLCTAHNDNVIGGAHQAVGDLLQSVDKVLDDLSARNGAKRKSSHFE